MAVNLKMFLLTADNLVRCHWDGRSRQVDVLGRMLEGEVLREVARDAGDPNPPVCRHQHGGARERGRRRELEMDPFRRARLS